MRMQRMGSMAKAETGGKAQHVERIPTDRVCGTQGEMGKKKNKNPVEGS